MTTRRPRTRNQWDAYLYAMKTEPWGLSGGNERKTGYIRISDSGSSSSREHFVKCPKGSTAKKRGGFQNIEESWNSRPKVFKRSKKSDLKVGDRRKPDVIDLSDDDVEFEEVFSNGSNLRVVSGSASGSLSKIESEGIDKSCEVVEVNSSEEEDHISDEDFEAQGPISRDSEISDSDSSLEDEEEDDDDALEFEADANEFEDDLAMNSSDDSKEKSTLDAKRKDRHTTLNGEDAVEENIGKSSSNRNEKGRTWKKKFYTGEEAGESSKKRDDECGHLDTRRLKFSHHSRGKGSNDAHRKHWRGSIEDANKERSSDDHDQRNEQENTPVLVEEMGNSDCILNDKKRSGKLDYEKDDNAAVRIPDLGHKRAQGQVEFSEEQGGVTAKEPENKSNHWFKNAVKFGNDAKNLDMAKILLESIYSIKERPQQARDVSLDQEKKWKFRFEDEVEKPQEKSEWDKQIDSLFREMEFCMRLDASDTAETSFSETEIDGQEPSEIDEYPAACCSRGEHQLFFDEQIGLLCKFCSVIVLDVKHVIAPFYKPPSDAQTRKLHTDGSPNSLLDDINFRGSGNEAPNSTTFSTGTVWDLICGFQEDMYPHQREGFEFMWKNLAGDTMLENLKQPLSSGGRGCIISHAPGTGKTRLSIVFIHSFLKQYPDCRPVIIAPLGMLLTWESEFKKWNVDIPFHNMNNGELSGSENVVAMNLARQVGSCKLDKDCIRLLKLFSWIKSPSVLGIGYQLYERLVEDSQEQLSGHIRTVLLEYPGLLVLDEGHTPRNDQSQMYNALTKVKTHRRIILSGTPFQNNLNELYNTLRLVNPMFEIEIEGQIRTVKRGRKTSEAKKNWSDLTSSIGKCSDGLKKLKEMLHSFVHVHKGNILEESLPGLRCAIVFLVPIGLQKTMLETAGNIKGMFECTRLVSLISVHPSLMVNNKLFSSYKSELQELESDKNAGVKLTFVRELIKLAEALGERVLVFSQYLDPLVFIREHLESCFSWKEGKEILYMDGKFDQRLRQQAISSFNDDASEARVLLASQKACCEGISLVGASRVVLLDTVWNPSVEKQAISRAYRLGQKKIVYVYRLFTSGTEVRQFERQIHKERISELIFSPLDGHHVHSEKPQVTWEDQVLDAMRDLDRDGVRHIFEKVVHQEKESDFVQKLGLSDV